LIGRELRFHGQGIETFQEVPGGKGQRKARNLLDSKGFYLLSAQGALFIILRSYIYLLDRKEESYYLGLLSFSSNRCSERKKGTIMLYTAAQDEWPLMYKPAKKEIAGLVGRL